MLKKFVFFITFPIMVTACDGAKPDSTSPAEKSPKAASTPNLASTSQTTNTASVASTASATQTSPTQKLTPDGKIQIDWKAVDNGTAAVPPNDFKYPFALDSLPVKNYMNAYQVDAKTAQHNLTIGMGANDPLSPILDQIDTSYVSHELTAGKGSKLIIHTTPKVLPSEHDYVIADPFAKGLILPIELRPDGKKDSAAKNPHQ